MARCLIVGCGCRGLSLGRRLLSDGHTVRGTTRDPRRATVIGAAGVEGVIGDPDRVSTLAPAFEHVAVACLLLGSATGSHEQLAALHGSRLEMMLTRMLDSTVRGIVYEAAGTVGGALLEPGAERVRSFCEDSHIPYVLLSESTGDADRWAGAALDAVAAVLTRRVGPAADRPRPVG